MSNPTTDMIQEIAHTIQFNQHFLVATHIRPDGDAVGSVLAMTKMLRQLGKQADAYCNDPVPMAYRFLPWWKRFAIGFPSRPDTKWPSSWIAAILGASERRSRMPSLRFLS